ncbi:hypothetical protein CRG98_018324 [Punica granatum]|uniref:Uncharacterized protein n=1 Tax=Punica granatum TaxID=22663 RepID=A0A2I0JZI2_PUNGR|nr:hypothetical protein CRG98_018324 [Punica granatum]
MRPCAPDVPYMHARSHFLDVPTHPNVLPSHPNILLRIPPSHPTFKPFPTLSSYPEARTLRVDSETLGTNDHHGHLEGSLGYPRPQTLPQKSIRSLRGDVRPDLCQSGKSGHSHD